MILNYLPDLKNKGYLSQTALDYISQAYAEVEQLYDNANVSDLRQGHNAFTRINGAYNFSINEFFEDAGLARISTNIFTST